MIAPQKTYTVSLPPELSAFIDEQVSAGKFADLNEAFRFVLEQARFQHQPKTDTAMDWLRAGGECGTLIRDVDWGATALGNPAQWSSQLRATINNVLNSPVPKVLLWGPEQVLIYNDGYREIAGSSHPQGGVSPMRTRLQKAKRFL